MLAFFSKLRGTSFDCFYFSEGKCYMSNVHLRGHGRTQSCFWEEDPEQGRPPLRGAGLLQSLVRFCTPFPQGPWHSPQDDQRDQPPFTGRENQNMESIIIIHFQCLSLHLGNASCKSYLSWYLIKITDLPERINN
jgi:hypothetical protein